MPFTVHVIRATSPLHSVRRCSAETASEARRVVMTSRSRAAARARRADFRIPNLINEQYVHILMAQGVEERRQFRGRTHACMNRCDSPQHVLSIFADSHQISFDAIDAIEKRVSGRGRAAIGRSGANQQSVGAHNEPFQRLLRFGREPQLVQSGSRYAVVIYFEGEFFTAHSGQSGETKVIRFLTVANPIVPICGALRPRSMSANTLKRLSVGPE